MIILEEEDLRKDYKNKKFADKAVKYLEERGLLPLYSTPDLARIVGHLMGDGSLYYDKTVGEFSFYGKYEKLKEIEKFVCNALKIIPYKFRKRERDYRLRYNNCIISRILDLIGVPRGDKVINGYIVPYWIIEGTLEIKRSFLIAICDDELSSPRYKKSKFPSVDSLRLKFNKAEPWIKEGKYFLNQIKNLFEEFGILCHPIKENKDYYLRRDNFVSRGIYFNISSKKENLKIFEKEVGFLTEKLKKQKLRKVVLLEKM